MGLNRPAKRNAFDIDLLRALGRAYEQLERDEDLRCGVLFAHGEHFTGGLDLAQVGPALAEGGLAYPDDARDPWRNDGKPWTTPVVAAVQGWCMTLVIELLLAADIRVAASDARFAQLEIQRGIYPFGGATIRLPRDAGAGERDALAAHRRRVGVDLAAEQATTIRALRWSRGAGCDGPVTPRRRSLTSAEMRPTFARHFDPGARLTDRADMRGGRPRSRSWVSRDAKRSAKGCAGCCLDDVCRSGDGRWSGLF